MSVERAISLLHIGKLATGSRQSLCLVRSLACDHAVVRASLPVVSGDRVTLGLRNGLSIAASVGDIQGERIWLNYVQPVSMNRLATEQMRGCNGPESVRIAVSGEVGVEAEGKRITAPLLDISLFGMRIADRTGALRPGGQVDVHIAGLTRRSAVIRWQADGYAGLRFDHSLGYELLDNWLITHGIPSGNSGLATASARPE